MKYGSMMSTPTCRNFSRSRMCSMFASDPVSKLSAQITLLPRASNSSHRCDPRKPAPPVTRHVVMARRIAVSARRRETRLSPLPARRRLAADSPPTRRRPAADSPRVLIICCVASTDSTEEHLTVAPIVGPDDPRRFTDSGIEIGELYTEQDLPADLDLGEPGEFPYTRGVHREMYRKQTWTMRQYACLLYTSDA